MALIPKDGKDKTKANEGYRPISLIPTHAKIILKVITERAKDAVHQGSQLSKGSKRV